MDDARSQDEIARIIQEIPDDVLQHISLAVPWQYPSGSSGASKYDADGAPVGTSAKVEDVNRAELQAECWRKYGSNPQINSAVRDKVGRVTGLGFGVSSELFDLNEIIYSIEHDYRNRLYTFWPKWVGRYEIEGELFLCLTVQDDGFIEVDYIDPATLEGGDDNTGIIFHPSKSMMPLFYNVKTRRLAGQTLDSGYIEQVPSIFVARNPAYVDKVSTGNASFNRDLQKASRWRKQKFGGYRRFIVAVDKGLMTRRATSYLKTTLMWLNRYEDLKNYEMDHKKSAASYLWVVKIEDPKSYKLWLSLSKSQREETGLMAKKMPGGMIILPPGMSLEVRNPQLTSITDQDNDILHMATAGLNETVDNVQGTGSSTFASANAAKGPQSDRTSAELAYFERFMRFDFWASAFFLMGEMGVIPKYYNVREAVDFKANKPVFKKVKRLPEQLIDISFPVSDGMDIESRAKAMLGTKHGPLAEVLGVNNKMIAQRMGFFGYGRMRLDLATEEDRYPKLLLSLDAESQQEKLVSEPGKKKEPEEGSDDGEE